MMSKWLWIAMVTYLQLTAPIKVRDILREEDEALGRAKTSDGKKSQVKSRANIEAFSQQKNNRPKEKLWVLNNGMWENIGEAVEGHSVIAGTKKHQQNIDSLEQNYLISLSENEIAKSGYVAVKQLNAESFLSSHHMVSFSRHSNILFRDLTSTHTTVYLTLRDGSTEQEKIVTDTTVTKSLQNDEWFNLAFESAQAMDIQALALLNQYSLFVRLPPLTPNNNRTIVVEKFHNGQSWVFVRHSTNSNIDIAKIIAFESRFYATTADGAFLERRLTSQATLEWKLHKDVKVFGAPRVSGRRVVGSIFFLNEFGGLVEAIAQNSVSHGQAQPAEDSNAEEYFTWKHYQTEFAPGEVMNERPFQIADAESFEPNLLFFIGEHGNLIEGTLNRLTEKIIFTNLGRPSKNLPLSPMPGVLLSKTPSAVRASSLFLLTLTGDITEFIFHSNEKRYEWVFHGHPDAGKHIFASPGPSAFSKAFFAVTSTGELVERHFIGPNWIWVHHDQPQVSDVLNFQVKDLSTSEAETTISLGQYVGVMTSSSVMVFLTEKVAIRDKKYGPFLADRIWDGNSWRWEVHYLPEIGPVSYCVSDKTSPNSCTKFVAEDSENPN